VALRNDGDVIKGVGYVAIYAAYVEEQIDTLLGSLDRVMTVDEKLKRGQTSSKIKAIKKRLRKLDPVAFEYLLNDLDTCTALLEARHEIMHGRIYGQLDGPDILHPGRPNQQKRPVTSIELYDLANQLSSCCGVLNRPQLTDIPMSVDKWVAT